jgi:hypothetical protein
MATAARTTWRWLHASSAAQVALGYALFGAVCFAASLQGGNKSA